MFSLCHRLVVWLAKCLTDGLAGLDVPPNVGGTVTRSGDDALAVATEDSSADIVIMLQKIAKLLADVSVPDADGGEAGSGEAGSGDDALAVTTEGSRVDHIFMLHRLAEGLAADGVPDAYGTVGWSPVE